MDWSGAFGGLAGALMLALAAWLLVLNPRSRLHRAFAIFLVLRGIANIVPGIIGPFAVTGAWPDLVWATAEMALPAAGVYFIVALDAYVRGRPPSRSWAWICLVVGAAGVVALLLKPSLLIDPPGTTPGALAPRPLDWWANGRFLVYAASGWIFARHFAAQPTQSEGRSSYLASLGLILNVANVSLIPIVYFVLDDVSTWGAAIWALAGVHLASLAVVLATLVLLARLAVAVPTTRRSIAVYWAATVLAMLTGVPADVGLLLDVGSREGWVAYLAVVDGIWTLAMPILVAHAILRHGIFGADPRVTLGLRRGTVAALLLAAFFVATEVANNFLQVSGGWIFGSIAAGIMLFAASPLQRAAERWTQLPQGRPTPDAPNARGFDAAELYRDHLRVIWADGNVSTKERALLRQLRDRLGLSPADAERLEDEVLGS